MNLPGAYDGIDMEGIAPLWYEPYVRADDQREVLRYDPTLRIIWTPRFDGYRVVVRAPGHVAKWADGWLRGWGCCWLRKPPLDKLNDVPGTLAELRFLDKLKNFRTKEEADRATEEGWRVNDAARLGNLRREIGAPIVAEMTRRAETPGWILDREEDRRRDALSGRRHVRRGRLYVPAGMGRR